MRFALAATAVVAVVVTPMAGLALAPEMTPDQFVNAVRCVAYADAMSANTDLATAKWRLNAEATRQSPETNSRAQQQVSLIAREIALSSGSASGRLGADCRSGPTQV